MPMPNQRLLAQENARLHLEARRASDRLERLQRLGTHLARTRRPEEIAVLLPAEIAAAAGAAAVTLWLASQDGRTLDLVGSGDTGQRLKVDLDLPICEAARSGEPVFVRNRKERDRSYATAANAALSGEQSWAALPLVGSEGLRGGALLSFDRPQRFGPDDRAFLRAIAAQCALALDRARLAQSE